MMFTNTQQSAPTLSILIGANYCTTVSVLESQHLPQILRGSTIPVHEILHPESKTQSNFQGTFDKIYTKASSTITKFPFWH